MVDVLIGTGLLLGSTTPFLAVPSFVFVIGRQWIAPEERMLEARFGDAYRAYKGQVRRWV